MNESSGETTPDSQQPQKNRNDAVNAEVPKVYQTRSESHRQVCDQQNKSNSSFQTPYCGKEKESGRGRGRGRARKESHLKKDRCKLAFD